MNSAKFLRGYPIFGITLRKFLFHRSRLIIFILVQFLPIFVAYLQYSNRESYYSSQEDQIWEAQSDFVGLVVNYYVLLAAVVIALFFTVSITSEEINDQTISYFSMQPLSRVEIALWKYFALLLIVSLFYFLPVTILYWVKFVWDVGVPFDQELNFLVGAWILMGMAALLYTSAFFLLSLILPRPHLSCLMFGYVDQFFLGTIFSPVLGSYSPAYHLRAVASREFAEIEGGGGFIRVMSVNDSYLVIILFFVMFLSLALAIFKSRDLN